MNYAMKQLLSSKGCTPMGEYECQIPMPICGRVRGIDFCIADIVSALNAANITTIASCCGHGNEQLAVISLQDGRELRVAGHTPIIDTQKEQIVLKKELGIAQCDAYNAIYNAAHEFISFLNKAISIGELKLIGSDIGTDGISERLNALEEALKNNNSERGE